MSFKIDLQPDETLIFQNGVKGPRKPMSLGVSDRAVFIAREQHLRTETHYMCRIPIADVTEVRIQKIRGSTIWIVSGLSFLVGVWALYTFFSVPIVVSPPQSSSRLVGFGLMFIVLGFSMPFANRGRRTLTIETKGKSYHWKPAIFDEKPKVNTLQEEFLWACRYVEVPTRRLDIVTKKEVDRFWKWFISYASLRSADEKPIRYRLKKLCAEIDVEISDCETTDRQLIITANFVKDLFPVVEQFIAGAPTMLGWKIAAFRPRSYLGETFQLDDETFETNRFFFIPYTDGFDLAIRLFVRRYENSEQVRAAAWSIVSTLLGEYDSMMKIRYYDFGDIEQADEDDLRQLSELPKYVDEFMRATAN